MVQILRKKDTITVDDMKKEAEREARTMWEFICTFLKWLVIAGVTGGIGGLVGSAFHLSVNWAAAFRAAHPWLLWLLPIGGLLIAAIYRLTKMENKNTNAIIDAIHFGDKVPLLLVPAIYLSTVITHLFGGSAGREGAALQIGGSLGCYVGQLFHLDEKDMRIATLCGMSAVFSALFGTPLTATIFALEVISVGVFYYSALVPCIVASLAALAISNAFGIAPTHFTFALTAAPRLLLLRVAALAAVCSLMSILFCVTMHGTERLFAGRIQNPWLRIAAGGAIVVVLTLLVGTGDYNGAGMDVITRAIEGGHITTIENYEKRIPIARENFRKAGRESQISLLTGDATEILGKLDGTYDFIFMDAAKGQYIHWLPDVLRLMHKGSILVSDNVLQEGDIIESHYLVERRNRTIYKRMRQYLYELKHNPLLETSILPLGDGAAISVKKEESYA